MVSQRYQPGLPTAGENQCVPSSDSVQIARPGPRLSFSPCCELLALGPSVLVSISALLLPTLARENGAGDWLQDEQES